MDGSAVELVVGLCSHTVPVGVPAVELRIANSSLVVQWTTLPPEKARGRITSYQVLLRRSVLANLGSAPEQPVIATVTAEAMEHLIDGMELMMHIVYFSRVKQVL